MQYAKFPIKKTWVSCKMDEGFHKDTKAIDFGILNPYNETNLYAPFDGKVVFVVNTRCSSVTECIIEHRLNEGGHTHE